jgi:hypothetical protein
MLGAKCIMHVIHRAVLIVWRVMGWTTEVLEFDSGQGKEFFSSQLPDKLWGQSHPLGIKSSFPRANAAGT